MSDGDSFAEDDGSYAPPERKVSFAEDPEVAIRTSPAPGGYDDDGASEGASTTTQVEDDVSSADEGGVDGNGQSDGVLDPFDIAINSGRLTDSQQLPNPEEHAPQEPQPAQVLEAKLEQAKRIVQLAKTVEDVEDIKARRKMRDRRGMEDTAGEIAAAMAAKERIMAKEKPKLFDGVKPKEGESELQMRQRMLRQWEGYRKQLKLPGTGKTLRIDSPLSTMAQEIWVQEQQSAERRAGRLMRFGLLAVWNLVEKGVFYANVAYPQSREHIQLQQGVASRWEQFLSVDEEARQVFTELEIKYSHKFGTSVELAAAFTMARFLQSVNLAARAPPTPTAPSRQEQIRRDLQGGEFAGL